MADELKEHVTTPWMQNELTAEEINRDDKAGENTGFWILRGKGSGRDRFINLKNLRVWIQAAVDAIAYIKDNGISGIKKALSFESDDKKTDIEAGSITFWEGANSYGLFIEDDALHYGGSFVFEDLVSFQSKAIFNSLSGESSLEIEGDKIVLKDSEGSIVATFANNGYFLGLEVKNIVKAGSVSTDMLSVEGAMQCNKGSSKVSFMKDVDSTGSISARVKMSVGAGEATCDLMNGYFDGLGTILRPRSTNPFSPTSSYPASAHPYEVCAFRYNNEVFLCFSNGSEWKRLDNV